MGLDMYLSGKRTVVDGDWKDISERETYRKVAEAVNIPAGILDRTVGIATVSANFAYWRKENAIHQWFVDNVQDGDDNCAEYYASREKLAELVETCKKVLENHELATELLPTSDGFFFGSTDYDDWYYKGLEYTVTALSQLLENPEYEDWDFYYQSSW
jgi:hypothetical protein